MKWNPLNLYLCSICKLRFPFEKIKYMADGKSIICIDCSDKLNKVQKKAEPKQVKIHELQDKGIQDRIKVSCMDCNYKFSLRKGSRINWMCPYCGKTRIRKDQLTSDMILNEVSRTNMH